jgi:serine/threonine protein kinase
MRSRDAGAEGANFALVTEFCSRGSLFDLLVKKKKKLPLITLVRMARDAAAGVLHLHKVCDTLAHALSLAHTLDLTHDDVSASHASRSTSCTETSRRATSWSARTTVREHNQR